MIEGSRDSEDLAARSDKCLRVGSTGPSAAEGTAPKVGTLRSTRVERVTGVRWCTDLRGLDAPPAASRPRCVSISVNTVDADRPATTILSMRAGASTVDCERAGLRLRFQALAEVEITETEVPGNARRSAYRRQDHDQE